MSLCPKCHTSPRRRPGAWCTACDVARTKARRHGAKLPKAEPIKPPRFARVLEGKRYLITSAQNATPVHAKFFGVLKIAAKHLRAELVVIPLRYKNPTSRWSNQQDHEEWWAPEVKPYLFNQRKKLGPHLVIAADVKIQPTASSPLTGFESLTGPESCIIGHPKMQFRSVAALPGNYPKTLTTTGACTARNYTDSKAGKLGDFHHYLGAVFVELDGQEFHLRQINADRATGSFIDLDREFTLEGVRKAPPALALVTGDTHARMISKTVDRVTYGKGGLVDLLDPAELVWHDTLDGYAGNPHHAGNPFVAIAKAKARWGNVGEEVRFTIDFVRERTRGRKSVIVASNHDDFLARWVVATDWRYSPGNADFYLETAQAMVKTVKMGEGGAEYGDPFVYWVNKLKGDAKISCLQKGESHLIGGNEVSLHGHQGPNGARGSLKNLSRLGMKTVSGHSHTPGIEEGGYAVGTSTPRSLEYTAGPSSWQNTHCVIYANGKRSLITIKNGAFKAA